MSDTEQHWITEERHKRRHKCENELPQRPQGDEGDLWVCPSCRRRWRLTHKRNPDDGDLVFTMASTEGVEITGPDGSEYWRAYRGRFIGRIGT